MIDIKFCCNFCKNQTNCYFILRFGINYWTEYWIFFFLFAFHKVKYWQRQKCFIVVLSFLSLSLSVQMQNRMAILMCNLKPAKMRGVVSQAMVMCASSPDKVEILDPPSGAVPGDRITFQGFPGNTSHATSLSKCATPASCFFYVTVLFRHQQSLQHVCCFV